MKVNIYGKNITVTPALSEKIEKKLNHLEKYFMIDDSVVANVVVRVYPNKQKIEVTIPTKYAVLRTEVVHDDLYAAIDLAIDKLEDQIRRQKTRLTRKNKENWRMPLSKKWTLKIRMRIMMSLCVQRLLQQIRWSLMKPLCVWKC